GEVAVRTNDELWFVAESGIAKILMRLADALGKPRGSRMTTGLIQVIEIIELFTQGRSVQREIMNAYQEWERELTDIVSREELVTTLQKAGRKVFDPHVWSRKAEDDNRLFETM